MASFGFFQGEKVSIGNQRFNFDRKIDDETWQLMNDRTGQYITKTDTQLKLLYLDRQLQFVQFKLDGFEDIEDVIDEKIRKNFADYPEALQNEASRRYKYIKAFEKSFGEDESKLKKIAEEVGDESIPSSSSLRRWTKRFKESDGNICSLIPEYFGRGNRKDRFTPEVADIAMRELRRLHLSPEKFSLKETLSSVRDEIEKENIKRPQRKKLPKPGRKFLRRLVASVDAYERMRARYGKAAADRYFRTALKSGERVAEPLLRLEIDHTVLDLIVVHPETFLPLGRPTITVALDRCTRCLVGFYVSFDPPSYVQVMKCLAHAIKPKDYLRAKYPQIENSWPYWGVPQQIMVDNGKEFHSKDLEAAALSLLIDIRYSPVAQPWWKGAVERFLGTLSKDLIHTIRGTTFSNPTERGDYKSTKQAVVTLDVLDEMLHTWICDVYHQKENRNTLRTPASLWRELIDPTKQRLPASAEELDVSVSSVKTRTLHHYGIELNNLKYNSSELMKLRRRVGGKKFKIRWDRSDLGEIHVLDESINRYLKVPCTWYSYASGVSLWLHKAIRSNAEKFDGEESETKLDAAKARLREICRKAITSKKMATRKAAARAEEGLESNDQQPKPASPIPNIGQSPTKSEQTAEGTGRPVWEDDDDDEIPEFVTIHRPEKQELDENHEEEESL